jgi:DNA repair ATPase RecN
MYSTIDWEKIKDSLDNTKSIISKLRQLDVSDECSLMQLIDESDDIYPELMSASSAMNKSVGDVEFDNRLQELVDKIFSNNNQLPIETINRLHDFLDR